MVQASFEELRQVIRVGHLDKIHVEPHRAILQENFEIAPRTTRFVCLRVTGQVFPF